MHVARNYTERIRWNIREEHQSKPPNQGKLQFRYEISPHKSMDVFKLGWKSRTQWIRKNKSNENVLWICDYKINILPLVHSMLTAVTATADIICQLPTLKIRFDAELLRGHYADYRNRDRNHFIFECFLTFHLFNKIQSWGIAISCETWGC